jgi:Conserved secreted protein
MIKVLTYSFIIITSLFLSSCKKIKDPEYRRLEHFSVKNIDLQKAVIGFSITYFNPNSFGVSVKEAVADVYIDSLYLGKFTQDHPVDVESNSEFSIPVSGCVSLITLTKLNYQNIGNRDIHVKSNGTIKVGKAGIFVTRPFEYEGDHKLEELNIHL